MRSDYPRIIIAADNNENSKVIKRKLSNGGIFASVMSFDEARHGLSSLDLLVISLERYSSPARALLSEAEKKEHRLPLLLICPFDTVHDSMRDIGISYAHADDDGCITKTIDSLLSFNLLFKESSRLLTDMSGDSFVVFCGVRLFLTKGEAAMLHYLNIAADTYADSFELAEALSVSPASVPVFINAINRKARLSYGEPIIRSKRSKGYYIIGNDT